MVILAIGSKQKQMRHIHMFPVADRAGSVVNALNLNAGAVVVVVVVVVAVVVVRMVAAKNENKNLIA